MFAELMTSTEKSIVMASTRVPLLIFYGSLIVHTILLQSSAESSIFLAHHNTTSAGSNIITTVFFFLVNMCSYTKYRHGKVQIILIRCMSSF